MVVVLVLWGWGQAGGSGRSRVSGGAGIKCPILFVVDISKNNPPFIKKKY